MAGLRNALPQNVDLEDSGRPEITCWDVERLTNLFDSLRWVGDSGDVGVLGSFIKGDIGLELSI